MNHQIFILVCFIVIRITCVTSSFSQFNPFTNSTVTGFEPDEDYLQVKGIMSNSMPTINCDSNYFWGVNYSGIVQQFTLRGDTVIAGNILDTTIPAYSLAVSNNLNGGTFNPTFYSSLSGNKYVYYYDNAYGWSYVGAIPTYIPVNCAGNGDYLYFEDNSLFPPDYLMRYNGFFFTLIYTYDSMVFAAADIAVDDSGNIWCFTGVSAMNCKYIDVISPTGQLFKRLIFNFNTTHAYGCFMLNDTLYLGLGSSNPVYPNSLIPITISADSAYTGVPIAMPVGDWTDLASCTTGNLLAITAPRFSAAQVIQIVPNPTMGQFTLNFSLVHSEKFEIKLLNILGQVIYSEKFNDGVTQFSKAIYMSGNARGIYTLHLLTKDGIIFRKVVVE